MTFLYNPHRYDDVLKTIFNFLVEILTIIQIAPFQSLIQYTERSGKNRKLKAL